MSVHVAPNGHPPDVDAEHFHLIAPYERDAKRWPSLRWVDAYSGKEFAVATDGPATVGAVSVKSYRDVVEFFATHPEAKSADADGYECDRLSVGLLKRRHVHATSLVYIGKESRTIEELVGGLAHDAATAVSHYRDDEAEWRTTLLPFLKSMPRGVAASALGISKRAVSALRNGPSRPSRATRSALRRLMARAGGSQA